ncbi:MAG: deoxyribose-phosphate aldolase [Chloroflexota bacterium]|nr:deoxyribose-phosphate aldolase [Chloroflexota bacterium]
MTAISKVLATAENYGRDLPPAPAALPTPSGVEISKWIDHTYLKPEGTNAQIEQLCQEAIEHEFASVCINPSFVPMAAGLLKESPVAVCTVVGFPLGATTSSVKMIETLEALHAGAVEIDMVMNIGALKAKAYGQVLNDIRAVVDAAHNQKGIVKVIIEVILLTRAEKIMACLLCKEAGADFVKTSTGFASGGATVADVELMRRVVGDCMGVKAAGGVRTYEDALAMIKAGASRIGASSGISIVQGSIS